MSVLKTLIGQYQAWLVDHAAEMGRVEDFLRMGTYAVPGRFSDSEMSLEAAHTGVGVLSALHDAAMIHYANTMLAGRGEGEKPSLRLRKLREIRKQAYLPQEYRVWAALLTVVKRCEVLMEVWASRGGQGQRWSVVLLLEVMKAALRLLNLWVGRGRMVVYDEMPVLSRAALAGEPDADRVSAVQGPSPGLVAYRSLDASFGSMVGDVRRLSPLNLRTRALRKRAKAQEEARAAQAEEAMRAPGTPATQQSVWAEVCHILRPVAYVASVRLFGESSWKPTLVSLVLDILQFRWLITRALFLNAREQQTLIARALRLLLYFFRGPLYRVVTLRLLAPILWVLRFLPFGGFDELARVPLSHYFFFSGS